MAAFEWAVREAALRGGSVHALMAWQGHPQIYGEGVGLALSVEVHDVVASAAADEVARLDDQSRSLDIPAVPTTWEAVEGHPAGVLVTAADDADLLVVGSRGRGGFVGMLLGSVSRQVLSHARCPVVVVPDPERVAPQDRDAAVPMSLAATAPDRRSVEARAARPWLPRDIVEEWGLQSFPASDPPANW
jgi:nucleotide-binding universal stress UspA family protein